MTKLSGSMLVLVLALAISRSSIAALPFVFSPGAPIRASELNANFQALDDRINSATAQRDFVRVPMTVPPGPGSVFSNTFTVPAIATRPYVLKAVYATPFLSSNDICSLQVGSVSVFLSKSDSSGYLLPVVPDETVRVVCSFTATGGGGTMFLIFSK